MNWLLWREYRLNRSILVVGTVGILLPHGIVAVATLLYGDHPEASLAWLASTLFAEITVALLAGNAIAGERADRSVEFIASLPLPPRRLVASKLLLGLIVIAAICSIRLMFLTVQPQHDLFGDAGSVPVQLLVVYGASWLFSSIQPSAVIATSLGIVTSWTIGFGTGWFTYSKLEEPIKPVANLNAHYAEHLFEPAFALYAMFGIPIGIVCFCIGTWFYIRRRSTS